jgi:TonB family protein
MNRRLCLLVPLLLAVSTVTVGQLSHAGKAVADCSRVSACTTGNSSNADDPNFPRVRVSSDVADGYFKKKVNPRYPKEAKQAGIEGQVVLRAEISKEGTIQNLQLVSGHPVLAAAATEAVKKWKYKPNYKGNPVAGETQVLVNFELR